MGFIFNKDIELIVLNRAAWYKVHSWVGFKLSILLSFILITGTLAVFSHEIDWLTNSAKRVAPGTVQEVNWLAIYQAARAELPNKHFLNIRAPIDPWFSAEVAYFKDETTLHRAFFHPTTGNYLGEGRWNNWQRFFRMSHRHLTMPIVVGVSIVGLMGILMLFSLVTSLVIYRKWWKGFFRMPRTSHRKVFWGDIHRLFGVWSIWFILVICITGVWYLLELWGLKADYPSRGKATSVIAQQKKVMPSVDTFAAMLAQAAKQYPQQQLKLVFFPQKAGQSLQLHGQAEAILVRPRANMLSFDPVSADLVAFNKGEDLSIHARISEAADPLHYGTFAGMPSKIIYFIFGAILSTLAITGTYIYGMRVTKVSKEESRPRRKIWSAAITKMTWGKWLSYLSIIVCFSLTYYLFVIF